MRSHTCSLPCKNHLVSCLDTIHKLRARLNFCLLLILGLGIVPLSTQAQNKPKPNVIIIYVDDLGWQDLGFMGNKFTRTPHIDKLAAAGRIFTNAYANAPVGAPSRASLLTGQHTTRHGILTSGKSDRGPDNARKLLTPQSRRTLAPEAVTIAEFLQKAGYTCASIGKWHLGDDPKTQGFNFNVGGNSSGKVTSYFAPYKLPNLKDGQADEYLTDRLTTEALLFMRANRKAPFLLYLSHFAVRTPLAARNDLYSLYKKRYPYADEFTLAYAAMVQAVDRSVGRIRAELDRLDLTEHTLIILASDNGGDPRYSSLGPLRGGKGSLYEGGLRTPFVLTFPGTVAPGKSDVPISGIDIFPTVAAIADLKTGRLKLDGQALKLNEVGAEASPERELYWFFPAYVEGSLESGRNFNGRPGAVIRRGDYKLTLNFEDNSLRLANLAEDIAETRDLAKQSRSTANSLNNKLRAWLKSVGAKIPQQPNPRYVAPAKR